MEVDGGHFEEFIEYSDLEWVMFSLERVVYVTIFFVVLHMFIILLRYSKCEISI